MKRAIVVGAGISGLTTGLGLRRAGFHTTIFERGRDLASVQAGGGMHLWNNAIRALQQLDLADRAEGAGEGVDRFEWYTDNGRVMGSGDVTELTQRLGAPAVGLTRRDLHEALSGAAGDDLIQFGHKCTGFEQDSDGVTVRFDDGSEERADVLIGADGVGSAVRQQLQGDSEPRYSGVAVCQAVLRTDEELIPPRVYGMLWGRGVRFGFYPINGGAFWYLLVAQPRDYFADAASRKQKAVSHVEGWADPPPRLIGDTPDSAMIAGNIVDREPVQKWGEGRVTLVGDAAHAMTPFLGQGGGQGIEDAAVVTAALSEKEDVPAALRDYEDRRRERTAFITRRAWKVGQTTKMKNPLACAVRNRIVTMTFPRIVWPEFDKIISTDFLAPKGAQQ